MTVYKPPRGKTFLYDFEYQKVRHWGNTKQTTKIDAARVENKVKERLRRRAGGIDIHERDQSPRFQDWAEVFYTYKAKRLERPEAIGDILPVALRFWGHPDDIEPSAADPCHDLRLCDPIDDPAWILKYEQWLEARGLGAQSKNHYRGLIRRMYAVALLPEYRQATGIIVNPFAGVPNDPTTPREVTLDKSQLCAWLTHAAYHIRLAVAIGALAPKLRLTNILKLQWGAHFDPDPRKTKFNPNVAYYIQVQHHKTARKTRRPLVSPVSRQLLQIFKDAWRRHPQLEHVVVYQGRALHSITGGVRAAVEAAGLPYGRDREDGVTFHTLRHTATTMMSDQQDDPLKLMDAMGHTDLATTLRYRHTRPRAQRPAIERLSRSLRIARIVTAPSSRAAKKRSA